MRNIPGRVAAFVLISVSVSISAKAEGPGTVSDNLFAKLQTQFNQGTMADLTPLVGRLDSGRCFTSDAPSTPIASVLWVASEVVDDGPLQSGAPELTASLTADPRLPANYFDSATVSSNDANVDATRLPLSLADAKNLSTHARGWIVGSAAGLWFNDRWTRSRGVG